MEHKTYRPHLYHSVVTAYDHFRSTKMNHFRSGHVQESGWVLAQVPAQAGHRPGRAGHPPYVATITLDYLQL